MAAGKYRGSRGRSDHQTDQFRRLFRLAFESILTILAIIVGIGPASAMCTTGGAVPCLSQSTLTTMPSAPGLTPSIIALSPSPKIDFKLTRPPLMTAQVQVYIAATPSPNQQVLRLRREAASLLNQIRFKGYQVSFEQLRTILSPIGEGSPDAENYLREAQGLLGEYLIVLRDIERINLGMVNSSVETV